MKYIVLLLIAACISGCGIGRSKLKTWTAKIGAGNQSTTGESQSTSQSFGGSLTFNFDVPQ